MKYKIKWYILLFMKMVLKVLSEKENASFDRERFWAKIDLPNGKQGFLPSELAIDDDDKVFFICSRPNSNSFFRFLPPKPIPEGSFVSLAFQDGETFELWSGEIKKFIAITEEGLDKYELQSLKQEMAKSEREKERFLVSVPLKIKVKHKVFHFTGAEISENGLGLWLPSAYKNRIKSTEAYTLTFEPTEVEPFSFIVQSVRPNLEDSFNKGFVAGFSFVDLDPNSVSAIRIKQLISARGKLSPNEMPLEAKHYLQEFWKGESFEV